MPDGVYDTDTFRQTWRGSTLCSKCHGPRFLDSLRGIQHLHGYQIALTIVVEDHSWFAAQKNLSRIPTMGPPE